MSPRRTNGQQGGAPDLNGAREPDGRPSGQVLADAHALFALSRTLTRVGNLDEKLNEAVEQLAALLSLDRIVIITFDLARRAITGFYKGGPGVGHALTVSYDELAHGLSGWVLRERRPALSPRGTPDPRESALVRQRRSATNCGDIIVVPLMLQDQLLGTLTAINRPDQRDLTATDVDLMVTLAGQVALAIENHTLYQSMAAEVRERQRAQAELEQAYSAIEQKVAERTRALSDAERLSQATLDALPEHICVLDERCTIIAVNKAWHEFATANPPTPPDHFIGANYLATCDSATGASADEAPPFAAGIRAVLAGERDHFSLEYLCSTPWGEERRFLAKVTRFHGQGPTRLVVAHENITQRKLTEAALRRQNALAQSLLLLSQALARAQTYEAILCATHAQTLATLGYDQLQLYLFDDQCEYAWSLAANGGPAAPTISEPEARLAIKGDRLLEAIAAPGEAPSLIAGSPAGQPIVKIPLRIDERHIGALVVSGPAADTARGLSPQEHSFLTAVSHHVSLSLDRIRVSHELKGLFATMADGVIYQNAQGEITFANPAAERILGRPLAELCGHSFLEPPWATLHEDGSPFAPAEHPAVIAMRTAQPVLNTVMGIKSQVDGQTRWLMVNATPQLRAGERAPHQIFTTLTDITERKQAEEERRASEERLRSFIEQSSEGVVMSDEQGHILEWNRAMEHLSGIRRAEVIGAPFWEVHVSLAPPQHHDPHYAASLRTSLEQALATGQSAFLDKPLHGVLYSRRGEQKHILQTAFPIQTKQGYRIGSVIRDITEQKVDEARLLMLSGALEAAANAIVIMDPTGSIQWANRAFTTLTGYTLAEMIGKQPRELVGDDEQEHFSEALWETLLAGQVWKGELLNRRKDGGHYEEELTITPLFDEQGRIKHFIEIKQDVSERKRNEAARIESEEKYRSLIESLESVIATVDADGVYHYMNRIAAASLGGTPAGMVGRRMQELFPPEAHEPQLENIRHVIATGVGVVSEARSSVAGRPRWFRTSIQPVRDASGAVTVALVNAMDITERKEAEIVLEERVHQRTAELESIRRRLELATRAAAIGIWDWDCLSGQILWDDQMLVLYGIDRASFHEGFSDWEQRLHPDERQAQVELIQACLRREREFDTDFRVIWPDQSEHHLHAKAITLFDPAGRPLRMIGVNYEITVRKHAELVLRQREETLQQANAELARANRAKDEFLANMSHELRTPLNGILALSEALLEQTRGPLNERQVKSLTSIESSGRHLLTLINDILDVSKIEAGRLELSPDLLDLNDLCQASLAFVKEPAVKKGVSLHFRSDATDASLYADGRRLKQILINLLSNAVKFTPFGGKVSLEVSADEQQGVVSFAVEDTGIGISAEDLPRLFTPFVQLDTSLTRQHEGSGLGLALVSRLVRLHGGSISVTTDIGHGSRFSVALPWVAAPEAEDSAAPEPLETHFERALVIDNSPIASEQLAAYLGQMQIEAQVLLSGQNAYEQVAAFQPQLIFLDLLMPETSGWEVLARLKADARARHIPTVIVSILDERQAALQAGADEYLLKPYTRAQLQNLLLRLSARSQPAPAPAADSRPPVVLLVEDSVVNIESVSDYLQFHGYEVIVAYNGQEGLELAAARRPDLILMDIQMPVMDGLEATRQLRAMPGLATTPVIALTALAMAGDRERCLEAGATDYLSKPVSLKSLLTLVRQLLATPRA